MKNPKKWIAGLALALAAAVAWGGDKAAWDEGYRKAVEEAVQRAGAGMGSVSPWEGATVAILPIHGDEDGWVSELLKIALSDAGVACVQLEGDPMWEPIGEQLLWNDRSSDILDPATVRLVADRTMKSATVLLTGSVRKTTSRTGRTGAVLTLHATDVATTVHAWGGVFRSGKAGEQAGGGARMQTVSEAVVPLNAKVVTKAGKGSELEAEELETWARGRLAKLGYRVDSGKEPDLTLALETTCAEYDRMGNYIVYEGTAKASLAVRGGDARVLDERSVPARGERGLGEMQAHRNLYDEMVKQLGNWINQTLESAVLPFAEVPVAVTFAEPIETPDDFMVLDMLQKALSGLDGVRSAEVTSQDNAAGRVEYRVVYDRAKIPGGVVNALWAKYPDLLDRVN